MSELEGEQWFSAQDLAELGDKGIAGLPRTPQGVRDRAKRAGWKTREIPGKGGPGGMLTQYQLDLGTLDAVRAAQEASRSAPPVEGERRVAERRHAERRALVAADHAATYKLEDGRELPIPPGFEPGLFGKVLIAIDEVLDPAETGMSIEDEGYILRALYARFYPRRDTATPEEIADYLRFAITNAPNRSA